MDKIVEEFKKYLKAVNKFKSSDFQKSNHFDLYFNLNKLKEIINKEIKPSYKKIKVFEGVECILFSEIIEILQTIKDVRDYLICDLLCVFNLTTKFETNGLELLIDQNKNYNCQFLFTHTLSKYLQKNFPTMTLTIEENFLQCLDKDIIINKTKGMRVDIVINEAKIVIEYDESQHEKYDNIEKDELRDCVIKAYGYRVIRFKEGVDLIEFFMNLTPIIKEQEFMENPKLLGKYIVEFFTQQNYRKDIIEKLTSEIVLDIIENIPYKNIGKTPRNLKLTKDIFNWLYIDMEVDKEKIIQILLNDINEPFEEIIIENTTDYILSPDAFEELLIYINAEEYQSIIEIKRAYINIKKKLLQYIYEQTEKMKNLMDHRVKLLKYVSNEGYNRGIRDTFTKCKKLENEKNKLQNENNLLHKIIDNTIPKNKRGRIKKNIISIQNELIINKPIIEYIPELIYTGSSDDYINENNNEIKTMFEHNKNTHKINISYTECLNLIKTKLQSSLNTNSLTFNCIFGCKIIIQPKKTSSSSKEDDEDDNDEEDAYL